MYTLQKCRNAGIKKKKTKQIMMKKTVRHRAVQFSDITENMWNRNETQTQNTVSAVASVGLSTSEGRGKGEDGKYQKIHPINRQTNGEQLAILHKSVMGKIS